MHELCAPRLGAAPHRPIVGKPLQLRHGFFLETHMKIRAAITAAAIALTLVTLTGCAVTRGQQTAGAYIDDTVITASVKTGMLDDARVAGTSITVETLNGTVMLSGFAKSEAEKAAAESIARKVDGVRAVKNEITVRPTA
jgi:hyperosmotically inducible periplasmic protein